MTRLPLTRRSFLGTAAAALAGVPAALAADEKDWPAWRKAMTAPHTIYNISDNAIRNIKFTFPGGQIPAQFANADGEAGTGGTIFGYGGGVHMRGAGAHGVIAFGSGGENFAGNMTGALNLNGAMAHYEVWQQPQYSTKTGPGVEFFWDPAEADKLPANRKFPLLKFDKGKWDGGYPLAIGGWIYPGPVKYVEPVAGVPLGQYRYDQHCTIPAEHTGLDTGVWFIPNVHFMAPGSYYGIDMALCGDFWPSGKKKWYTHYQREDTKAWTRLPDPVPEGLAPGSFSSQVVGFSAKHKQVVVPCQSGNRECAVFDVSRGLAKGAWAMKPFRKVGAAEVGIRCGQKSAVSNGHPRNRALFVWYNGPYGKEPAALNILDLDDANLPIHAVKLPLTGTCERIGLHYLPDLDKFISFGVHGSPEQAFCQKITIPDNLAKLEAYTVEDVPLALAPGVDLATSYTNSGMVQYVEKLNCVVFMATGKPAKAFWLQ